MEKLGWEEELLGLGQLMRGCFNFVFFSSYLYSWRSEDIGAHWDPRMVSPSSTNQGQLQGPGLWG